MSPRKFVLASASPRRRELIAALGIDCEIVPSRVDEAQVIEDLGPAAPFDIVMTLARAKAQAVASAAEGDSVVLGADTVVVIDDVILGKPRDPGDAVDMLMRLQGRTHQVYTGIALASSGPVAFQTRSAYRVTDVEFAPFTRETAAAYVATGEPLDKAGAYGIQALGALLITQIRGDYFNVVGLPLNLLGDLLRQIGWNLL